MDCSGDQASLLEPGCGGAFMGGDGVWIGGRQDGIVLGKRDRRLSGEGLGLGV